MVKHERVALVKPYLDQGDVEYMEKYWQPLDLLALEAFLRAKGFEGDIKIFDQAVLSREQVNRALMEFRPMLVGFNTNAETYDIALDQARLVKSFGAEVVFGGSYATTLAANILRNQKDVDYVARQDGEQLLLDLVNGKDPTFIPNLVFRARAGQILTRGMVESVVSSNSEEALQDLIVGKDCFSSEVSYEAKERDIVLNRVRFDGPGATFAEFDYSRLGSLEPYFENYVRQASNKGPFNRPVGVLTARGCEWRCKTHGGCEFCFHGDPITRYDETEDVVRRIAKLKSEYGVDAVLFPEDDHLGDHEKFYQFHDLMLQQQVDVQLGFMYSRIAHITPQMVEKLAALKTWEIFFGIESANKRILKMAKKGHNPDKVYERIKLLRDNGITAMPSYVFGMRGENEGSIADTVRQVEKVSKLDNVLDAQFTICTPFPGSEAYERLIVDPQAIKRYPDVFEKTPQLLPKDTTMLKKHGLADAPSWELLQKDWASRFCDVDHERLQEVWRQIAKLDFRVFNPS